MNPKYRILHQHEMTISSEKQTCRATSFSFHLTYMFTTAFLLIVSSGGRGGGGGGLRGHADHLRDHPDHIFFSHIYLTFYISSVGSGSLILFWVNDPRPIFYLQHCIYFVSANAACPLLLMKDMLAQQEAPLTLGYWTAHCRTLCISKENNYFLI